MESHAAEPHTAHAFYSRITEDGAFLARVINAPHADARRELLSQEGFRFDEDEFEEATREFLESRKGQGREDHELSAAMLSLMDVIAVRIASFYGPPDFFRAAGPLNLGPARL